MPSYATPVKYGFSQLSTYRVGLITTNDIVGRHTDSFGSGYDRVTKNQNPSWRVKVAKRADASTIYARSGYESFTITPSFCESWTSASKTTGNARMLTMGNVPTDTNIVDAAVADMALARFKRKISLHTGEYSILVPTAELREMRGLIRSSAELVTDLVKELLLIKRTKGRSAFRYASQAWLTYGFGLSPLISDTQAICKALTDYYLRTDHTVRLTGKSERQWVSGKTTKSAYNFPFGCRFVDSSNISHTIGYKYTGAYNFRLRSSNDYGLVDHFNVNLPSLSAVAWELTAFSWVFDYFTTTGAYLEDVTTATSGNLLFLNRNRRYEQKGTSTTRYTANPGTIITSQKIGTTEWKYFEFERTPLAVLPGRSLRFKTADEIGLHSVTKLLNLVTVLGGKIST